MVNTLPNSPERAVCELAIWMSGAASVNGQCLLADGSDLLHTLSLSRATALLVDPDVTDSPWRVLKRALTLGENGKVTESSSCSHLKKVFFIRRTENGEDGDFIQGLETEGEWFQSDNITGQDMATMLTTSGSTGFSKLVARSHDDFPKTFASKHDLIDSMRQPVVFNPAPLGWGGGSLHLTLMPGTTRVLLDVRAGIPDDMVDFLWRSLQEERCHVAYFPTMYLPAIAELVTASAGRDGVMDEALSNTLKLKTIWLAGLPVTQLIVKTALKIADAAAVMYSSTETNLVSAQLVTDSENYVDYDCGTLLPGVEVKIAAGDKGDSTLPTNSVCIC